MAPSSIAEEARWYQIVALSPRWISKLARHYAAEGADALGDRRRCEERLKTPPEDGLWRPDGVAFNPRAVHLWHSLSAALAVPVARWRRSLRPDASRHATRRDSRFHHHLRQ